MSDNWLDHGHGRDPSHLPSVLSRAPSGPGDAAGPGAGPTRAGLMSRVSGPWFVAIVTAVVMLGSAGAAYAIRETLFPGLGAPTPQSVWQNPAPAEEPLPPSTSTTSSSSTTSTTSSTSTSTTVVDDDVAALDTPAPTEPSLSTPPNVTVDDHGGGTGSGHDDGPSPPAPSVTAAPVTTVDDHGGGPDPGDDDGSGSSGGSGGSGSGSGSGSGGSSGSGSGGGSDDTGPDD